MAELADAPGSGPGSRKGVEVRVLFRAPYKSKQRLAESSCISYLLRVQFVSSILTIEESEIGGTVAKYPRQKLVMTSPVEFPLNGKVKKTEFPKENLMELWLKVMKRADFEFRTGEKMENTIKDSDGIFTAATVKGQYRARYVVLALGKTGSPRNLGVKGEELPKVMYRLIEADHYVNKKILIVGGGDSAVEAAMGLTSRVGNSVTISYRKAAFARIKDRNKQRIEEFIRKGKLQVLFNSNPVEILANSVIMDVNGAKQTIANDFVDFRGWRAARSVSEEEGWHRLRGTRRDARPCARHQGSERS